jgi:dienelactone hydrolase
MTDSLLDLTSVGPYIAAEYTDSITVAAPGGSRTCRGTAQEAALRLPLTVTLPTSKDPRGQSSVLQDCPVVLFFNGFQSRACWYRAYTHRLASWGFAVVQYTTPTLKIIKDKDEIKFVDPLLSWAQNSTSTAGHFAHGCFDLESLCVTGHSRGGKLAALHFSSNDSFKAACLIDPVDNTTYTPESEDYPSACRALAGCKKPVGECPAVLRTRAQSAISITTLSTHWCLQPLCRPL